MILDKLQEILVNGLSEVIAVSVTVVIGLIKRKLDLRKLRRQGKLKD